jgi:hypothetical protein
MEGKLMKFYAGICMLLLLLVPVTVFGKISEIEPNGDMSSATVFTLGEICRGSGFTINDVDYWKFDLEAGQEIRLRLSHSGSWIYGTSDFRLQLRNSSGSILAESDHDAGSTSDSETITYTVISTGTYYMRVDLWAWSSAANAYSVTTTWENEPVPTPTMVNTPIPTETPENTPTPVDTPTPVSGIDSLCWEIYR